MGMGTDVATFIVDRLVHQGAGAGGDHDLRARNLASLGLDSLDFMELLNEIEEEFAIRIEDDTVSATTTVAGLIAFIEGRVAARDRGVPAEGR